jgi:hypothetical protein
MSWRSQIEKIPGEPHLRADSSFRYDLANHDFASLSRVERSSFLYD